MQLLNGSDISLPAGIIIQDDAGNSLTSIEKISVQGVSPTYVQRVAVPAGQYPVIANVTLTFINPDSPAVVIALQQVTNQPTWTIDQAGVDQAVSDITSWLLSGGGGGGTVTSITAGTGLTGGTITTSGTVALGIPVTVAHGGTGDTTLTQNGILFGNGTSAIGITAAGTTGQVLIGNTGSAPTWGSVPAPLLSATQIGFGNGSNLLTGSAKLTWDNTGNAFTAQGDGTFDGNLFVGNISLINNVPYAWTGIQGTTGQVLTNTDGAGALAWTTITGNAPIYAATQIPFGDGVTAGGVTSADLTFGAVGTLSNGLLVGISAFPVMLAETNNVNGFNFLAGDINDSNNGTVFGVSDSGVTFGAVTIAAQTYLFNKPNFNIATVPYVFPNVQATSVGQVLTNDSFGNLSWGAGVPTPAPLTATFVGYGDVSNSLTGTSNFNFINSTNTLTVGVPTIYSVHNYVFSPAGGGIGDDLGGGSGINASAYTGPSGNTYSLIIDPLGTPDQFGWADSNGNSGSNINITGTSQTLSYGLTVTFGHTTGHADFDEYDWVIIGTMPIGIISASSIIRVGGTSFIASSPNTISYTLPSAQGAASTVLTNNGSGGLSWGLTGSAPIYTNTLIPYGNSSTPGGITNSGFSYDNNNGIFSINFPGASVSQPQFRIDNTVSGTIYGGDKANDYGFNGWWEQDMETNGHFTFHNPTININGQALTFPSGAGTANAALITNGSGVLSWQTGFSGTVTPVTSITVVNGIVTAVS